ncbi:acyltransferase family protein [Bosea sp. MMO-172]|uniref:acyltransferase family protein n=1 Tax=Bosea sp. MMO-172 TaxID=3127885 RepID=UPI0030192DBD
MNSPELRYKDTNFITGLRAFAALAVVMIHTGGAGLRSFGVIGSRLADSGSAGVYVFFVISGFAVSQSFESSNSYQYYLVKRLRRIVPLYFFWLSVCILWSGGASAYSILMHVTFLSFLDIQVANSIIGIEWTIPIEIFYYLLIPAVLIWARRLPTLCLITLLALTLHLIFQFLAALSGDKTSLLRLHWSPIPYAFSFSLGMLAYRLKQTWNPKPWQSYAAWAASAAILVAYAIKPGAFKFLRIDALVLFSSISFIIITSTTDSNNIISRSVLCSRPIQYLGLWSYGIYLAHLPLNGIVVSNFSLTPFPNFLATSALTIAISALTYYLIERPGQRWRAKVESKHDIKMASA